MCPLNSSPIGGGLCRADPGFLEADGLSSGGTNNGPSCPKCGNPVNPANGNKYESQTVYSGPNGFGLTLAFNTFDDARTRFGRRWRDSFDRRISASSGVAYAFRPDGKTFRFTAGGGGWASEANTNHRLTEPLGAGNGWQLAVAEGDEIETYDAAGRLLTIRSRSGLTQTLAYSDGTASGPNGGVALDSAGNPTTLPLPAGLPIRATDAFGREITFGYDTMARVRRMTDPAGGVYRFTYKLEMLGSITFPDTRVRGYVYNEPANTGGADLPRALTGIIDENGVRFATFQYDAQQRIVATEHAGGAQRHTLSYSAGSTTVTDPLGGPPAPTLSS